jgi:hypothetical protein
MEEGSNKRFTPAPISGREIDQYLDIQHQGISMILSSPNLMTVDTYVPEENGNYRKITSSLTISPMNINAGLGLIEETMTLNQVKEEIRNTRNSNPGVLYQPDLATMNIILRFRSNCLRIQLDPQNSYFTDPNYIDTYFNREIGQSPLWEPNQVPEKPSDLIRLIQSMIYTMSLINLIPGIELRGQFILNISSPGWGLTEDQFRLLMNTYHQLYELFIKIINRLGLRKYFK